MRVKFLEGFDDNTNAQIVRLCRDNFGSDVKLDGILPSFQLEIGTIASLAGLTVGVISLCLQIWRQKRTEDDKDIKNEEDALRHLTFRINDINIQTVKKVKTNHIRNLFDLNGEPCEVSVEESSANHEVRVFVSLTDTECTISKI